jgi:hypothetical protein
LNFLLMLPWPPSVYRGRDRNEKGTGVDHLSTLRSGCCRCCGTTPKAKKLLLC